MVATLDRGLLAVPEDEVAELKGAAGRQRAEAWARQRLDDLGR